MQKERETIQRAERIYNVLIVEDEMMIASHIKHCLENENFKCLGIAKSYQEAMESLSNESNIDFLILDINLYGTETGIDLAKKINKTHHIPFFYLTSYSDRDTLLELRNTNPLGYLSKPINEADLITALQIAGSNLQKNKFTFKIGNTQYAIDLNELLYIQSDHVYVDMVFIDSTVTIRTSLNNIEKVLPQKTVLKANRSLLINPRYIKKIVGASLHIADEVFSISSTYKSSFE